MAVSQITDTSLRTHQYSDFDMLALIEQDVPDPLQQLLEDVLPP